MCMCGHWQSNDILCCAQTSDYNANNHLSITNHNHQYVVFITTEVSSLFFRGNPVTLIVSMKCMYCIFDTKRQIVMWFGKKNVLTGEFFSSASPLGWWVKKLISDTDWEQATGSSNSKKYYRSGNTVLLLVLQLTLPISVIVLVFGVLMPKRRLPGSGAMVIFSIKVRVTYVTKVLWNLGYCQV